ncbi:MAG: cell division protein SepF [Candidatus Aenigmatarchaeota archaeon]
MALKDLLKRRTKEEKEEFVEVEPVPEEEKINIKIENLRDYADTERIQKMLREGNIIFLKIREIRQKDITELKRSVDKLRKTCLAMNGDIAGVDEDFLIITPNFAKIYRGKST